MKKILLTTICLAFASLSFSQQLSRYVVSSGGNYSTSASGSLSSTIGESMVATLTSSSNVLTQGFQQSFSTPVDPTIVITNPLQSDNFYTSISNLVTVNFDVNDFVVGPTNGTGDGHIHYYVNGAMTMKYDILAIPLTNLANGNHEVIMRLVDNSHQPFTPNIADTVNFSVNLVYGCTGPTYCNYDPLATIDDGSCAGMFGCTDPLYVEYSSVANCDDGSCVTLIPPTVCDAKPTGLNAYDITDTRFRLGWDNMNTTSCMVLKYNVRYRVAATTTSGAGNWTTKSAGAGNGQCNFGLNNVEKLMINFLPSTTYDVRLRAMYCSDANPATGWSSWTSSLQVTLADVCPDLANMAVQTFNGQTNKAKFSWDATGDYMFARLYTRVNGGTAPFNWTIQGGFGINYPTFYKNIFTFTPGETYRVQGNSFCSATMTSYKGNLTTPVIWTQPVGSSRIDSEGRAINNLDVYPNPSRDVFNVAFTSEDVQDLEVRVLNIVGEVVYTENLEQFVGEYTKSVDLNTNAKGIYFLEIETNNGVINKKLILQ